MRDTVPVEHLLLLLRANAIIFVQKIQKRALGLFEGRIGAGFEVSQIGKDALLKLFRILHGTTKRLKSERKAANDVGTRDMK